MSKKFKFIDLFAGLGGFRLALNNVAIKNNFEIDCVFTSEINNEVIKVYDHNFTKNQTISFRNKNKIDFINIWEVDETASNVPKHNFLFAGFPCQAFSNAGKKEGFLNQTKGTLFFDVAKILNYKKPEFALLENVKHLVKHDNGNTWRVIQETLKEIGYITVEKPLILSPIDFGIPQDRPRVFIPLVKKDLLPNDVEYLKLDFIKNEILKNREDWQTHRKNIFENILEENVDDSYYLANTKEGEELALVLDAWDEFLKNVKEEDKSLPVIWVDEMIDTSIDTSNMTKWRKEYIDKMHQIYEKNKTFIDEWINKYDVKNWSKRNKKFEWQAGKDINDIKNSFIQLRQSGIRCRRPISFPTLVAIVQIPLIWDNNAPEKFNNVNYLKFFI